MTLLGEANWYLPRRMHRLWGAESALPREQPAAARPAAIRRSESVAQTAGAVESANAGP
jgi:hypothetical protein